MSTEEEPASARDGRFAGPVSLRRLAARGTIINGAFLTAVNALGMVRGVLVASVLGTENYGVWAVLFVMLATLMVLKQVGIGERFVQQDELDQEREFQYALTLEVAISFALVALGALFVTGYAALADLPELVGPGLLMLVALPLTALHLPLAIFYRRMDFLRQRQLQAVDPLVAFVVTVGLAYGGAGYWSLVIGTVAGAAAAAIAALVACPYRLRPRMSRERTRSYAGFSWPIMLGAATTIVTGQSLVIAGEATLGLAGVGVIALVTQISQFADRADRIVTETLYPALCAVKDRTDLLFEVFVKSNRVAVAWGLPFGVGVALFAHDLLVDVLGAEWEPGVELLRLVAITLGIHQIGFNWAAFYRARGDTRPLAVYAVAAAVAFLALPIPLLVVGGLEGLGWGVLAAELVGLTVRGYYLRRLFPRLRYAGHMARAALPTIPAAVAILAFREVTDIERTVPLAGAEVLVYGALVLATIWRFERPLLREMRSYAGRAATT